MIYFRLMSAIFDLPSTQTSESISISITLLSDNENITHPLEFHCYNVFQPRYVQLHYFSCCLCFMTSDFIWQCC
jgi:hypothetical protein